MKRTRWVFGAMAVAGIVVLVAPAVGQGKAASASLGQARALGGAGHVYWANGWGGTVNSVRRGGGKVATLAYGQSPRSVAVDGTHVYWTNGNGTVRKVRLGGGRV